MNDIKIPETKPLRGEGGKFAKGVSGNPGGRPKMLEAFTQLAQEHSEAALMAVVDILNDPDARTVDRLRAADIILDRGLGKPLQSSQIDFEGDIQGRMIEVVFSSDLERWSK